MWGGGKWKWSGNEQGREMEEEKETGWHKKSKINVQHGFLWDATAMQHPMVKEGVQEFPAQLKFM